MIGIDGHTNIGNHEKRETFLFYWINIIKKTKKIWVQIKWYKIVDSGVLYTNVILAAHDKLFWIQTQLIQTSLIKFQNFGIPFKNILNLNFQEPGHPSKSIQSMRGDEGAWPNICTNVTSNLLHSQYKNQPFKNFHSYPSIEVIVN